MRTIQIFRLAAVVATSSATGRHTKAKRALWALLGAIKREERARQAAEREAGAKLSVEATVYALRSMPSKAQAIELGLTDEDLEAWATEERDKFLRRTAAHPEYAQRGAVSLPLLTFQAGCAIGLASGVASIVAWAQGVLGGVL